MLRYFINHLQNELTIFINTFHQLSTLRPSKLAVGNISNRVWYAQNGYVRIYYPEYDELTNKKIQQLMK